MTIPLLTPEWNAPSNVFAYSSTRVGGVSEGTYQSLNIAMHVDDDPNRVALNRARLPRHDEIAWLEQVHSADVITLPTSMREADASISRDAGSVCAVMTADCVPVLLCNKTGTEVAAIHAGWKGLRDGIIANTLDSMDSSSDSLLAWIGPCISRNAYEVGNDVSDAFKAYENVFTPSSDEKVLLDLPEIARQQLHNSGIREVTLSGVCTYEDEERFFSHRRSFHRGETTTGRFVTVIGMR